MNERRSYLRVGNGKIMYVNYSDAEKKGHQEC